MKANILTEVSSSFKGWQPRKKPEVSPPLFDFMEDDYSRIQHDFIETMNIIDKGELSIYCTCADAHARDLRDLYYRMTGEHIKDRITYQADKYTVQIKTSLWLPDMYTEDFDFLVHNEGSLPWGCKLYRTTHDDNRMWSKWVTAGEGETKFGFYLIRCYDMRL